MAGRLIFAQLMGVDDDAEMEHDMGSYYVHHLQVVTREDRPKRMLVWRRPGHDPEVIAWYSTPPGERPKWVSQVGTPYTETWRRLYDRLILFPEQTVLVSD